MTPAEFASRCSAAGLAPFRADVLRAVVLKAEDVAKRTVPVRSGTLRRSITGRVETTGARGVVGSNVRYAAFVEDGTKFMRARPYLAPAIDEARDAAPALLRQMAERFFTQVGR